MPEPPRLRRTSIAIIVLASVIAFFAVFAVWAKRQILETDTWTQTSTQVLANHDAQQSLNTFLVDALFKEVNVEHRLKKALPDNVQGLAGPASAGIHQLALRAGVQAIESPTFQNLWAQANAKAHDVFLQIIEGGNETLSTEGGVVNLDLGRVVTEVAQNAGVDVKGKIPPKAARIELLRSDQLGAAQDAVNVLRVLDLALPALALALFALAIYLPRGWRREAVRASGFAFVAVGIFVLVARSIAGGIVVDTLATTDAVRPAADAVWGIATSLLRDEGVAMIAYGALIVVGAWLAGKTAPAREIRRALTPALTRRAWGYPGLLVIVLIFFWLGPTSGTSRLLPSLVLIALFIGGFEALRHQAMRDFPEETPERAMEEWKARWERFRDWVREWSLRRKAPAGVPEAVASDARLEALERLGRLRESGVLDAEEFGREKDRILAA
jgi:hypothetical protein